jgi:transposase
MDREWLLTASFILPAKTGGQRRTSDMREAVKAALCRFPWLRHVFADRGYTGDKLSDALALMGKGSPRIIKRSDTAKGFELLPRRWLVEPTFAWLGRCRRLAKVRETSSASSVAWTHIASIRMLMRRTARHCYA